MPKDARQPSLAIISTHPIQYNAPWFRLLSQRGGVRIKVFYTWSQSQQGGQYDPGFGKAIRWDIPLLEGYDYTFVENTSDKPGNGHFNGLKNPTLISEIEKWGANAVLIFGWNFHSHLQCMRYFHKRIPVLFRGDSTLLNEQQGIKKVLRRIFLKWIYSFVDYALYVGTENKKYFQAHGLRKDQLVFAPHAVDNDRFTGAGQPLEEEAAAWRKKLGLSEEDIVVSYAGKLEPVKNPFYFLQLTAGLKQENIKFLIIGNGPLEKELKEKAAADKRIVFLDFQNQKMMPLVYRLGDIFILPSVSETWGLAINEAMACRRPVLVSSRAGCAPDLVRQGVNGWIIDTRSADDCIRSLTTLLADPHKLIAMGSASADLIASWSFIHIAEAVEQLSQKIIA